MLVSPAQPDQTPTVQPPPTPTPAAAKQASRGTLSASAVSDRNPFIPHIFSISPSLSALSLKFYFSENYQAFYLPFPFYQIIETICESEYELKRLASNLNLALTFG
jgi:hypothetical protein